MLEKLSPLLLGFLTVTTLSSTLLLQGVQRGVIDFGETEEEKVKRERAGRSKGKLDLDLDWGVGRK